MSKKTTHGFISTIIITLTFLALFSVITWVIPFPNNTTPGFITTYVCTMVLMFAEGILFTLLFHKKNDKTNKINGLPVVYYNSIVIILQLLTTTIVYVVNCFVEVEAWILILVESFILIFAIVSTVFGLFFKKRTEDFKTNKETLNFVENTRATIQVLMITNENKDIAKALEGLCDTLRATDPVSNEKTLDVEQTISTKVLELKTKISEGVSNEELIALIKNVENLIKERSIYCKLGK